MYNHLLRKFLKEISLKFIIFYLIFISLGQALRAYGHRVRLATHETFRSFVRGNGLEFYPLGGDPADLISFMVKMPVLFLQWRVSFQEMLTKKRRSVSDILNSTWQACIADDDETDMPFTQGGNS